MGKKIDSAKKDVSVFDLNKVARGNFLSMSNGTEELLKRTAASWIVKSNCKLPILIINIIQKILIS